MDYEPKPPLKFQTKQPTRLLENGEIVWSADPRDFDTFKDYLLKQGWFAKPIIALFWLVGVAIWISIMVVALPLLADALRWTFDRLGALF